MEIVQGGTYDSFGIHAPPAPARIMKDGAPPHCNNCLCNPAPPAEARCAICDHVRADHESGHGNCCIRCDTTFVPPTPAPAEARVEPSAKAVGPCEHGVNGGCRDDEPQPKAKAARRTWQVHVDPSPYAEALSFHNPEQEWCAFGPAITVVEVRPGETLRAVVAESEVRMHRVVAGPVGFIPGIDDGWEQCRDGFHTSCSGNTYEHASFAVLADDEVKP